MSLPRNPSTWHHRIPIVLLSLVGFFISGYMGAFQLGWVVSVWDPIFGEGTQAVLTSDLARSLPVSDAALAAGVYLLEALLAMIGDEQRWQTKPWIVFSFMVFAVPASITGIVLLTLQPLLVHAWCSWCFLTTFISLALVGLSANEAVAAFKFLRMCRRDRTNLF